MSALRSKHLGAQWSVADREGMVAAAPSEPPPWMMFPFEADGTTGAEPPRNLKEYDPEWARAFLTGTLTGAISDLQLARVREILAATGASQWSTSPSPTPATPHTAKPRPLRLRPHRLGPEAHLTYDLRLT
ncbi:hypothetical protein LO762_09600 [Actinocorallia sp. API 0066]|uniref:hypothetical protein n=1 Tax=Actinocorallia sp. API 0066 TaxID=2896846 RepID=UPI001E5DF461|nr:hypothetical protein [Actinocorallia sp. API 0066]MCD0449442.1 hypothetical protein [Actinocorallia sp. API 0066]